MLLKLLDHHDLAEVLGFPNLLIKDRASLVLEAWVSLHLHPNLVSGALLKIDFYMLN